MKKNVFELLTKLSDNIYIVHNLNYLDFCYSWNVEIYNYGSIYIELTLNKEYKDEIYDINPNEFLTFDTLEKIIIFIKSKKYNI